MIAQDVVLRALLEDGDVGTVPEIAAATGLLRSEVEVALAGLKERGLVHMAVICQQECWIVAA